MAKGSKTHWQLHVRGTQREPLEADLVAQIVVMLGRQLWQETMIDPALSAGEQAEIDDQEVS